MASQMAENVRYGLRLIESTSFNVRRSRSPLLSIWSSMETYDVKSWLKEMASRECSCFASPTVAPPWFLEALMLVCLRFN
jgi:hypothetical protein